MNSVQLVGNLTRDPEKRTTQSGLSTCSFTLACQRKYKNAQGVYDADFISCVAWRQTADFICKYFQKGSKIGLTGSIQTRSYEKDGQKRYVTEVVVDEAEFVTPSRDSAQPQTEATPEDRAYEEMTPADDDDELPF